MKTARHPVAEVTSQTASILSLFLASAVLFGWLFNLPAITSILPGLATMKFNTALCFAVSASALWLLRQETADVSNRRAGLGCALAVVVIALSTLGEYAFGWNLGIDELAVRDLATDPRIAPPGRMSLVTAQCFAFLGLSLLLIDVDWRRFYPAQTLALLAALAGLIGLLGYLFDVTALYRFFPYSSIALHTATLFVVLGFGVLLARPDRGLMSDVTSDKMGGFLARRFLPLVFVLFIVTGWLELKGKLAGYYEMEVGTALFSVAGIVILMTAVWLGARSLNRVHARLEKRNRLYSVLSQCNQAIVHSKSRDELFPQICRVAVNHGEFRLAWIGLVDPGTKTIKIAAYAGKESEFLAGQLVESEGSGPCHEAIRDGRHVICNDVRRESREASWSEATFPLFEERRAIGALCVHAAAAGYFGDDEINLLDEVAFDVSFALTQFGARWAQSRLAAIVESTEDAIVGTNLAGTVTSWNGGAKKIFGYAADEMCGQAIERLVPDGRRAEFHDVLSRILQGEGAAHFEMEYVRNDGRSIDVSISVSCIEDSDGQTTGISVVGRDITVRKQAEEKLRFHEALLRETGHIAKVGGWQFDVATGEGFWTDEVARIHDLDPADSTSREIGLSFYEAESRSRIEAAIREAKETGTPYDLELQMTTAAGTRKWVRTIGHPVVEGETVVRLRGTFQDITELKRAERRQATRNAVSRALADSATLSVAAPKIMEAICESESWDFGAIWEVDRSANVLRCAEVWYWSGVEAAELADRTRGLAFAPGEGLPGRVWSTAKGVLIPDVADDDSYPRAAIATAAGLRSALAFPIVLRGEVTGVLDFLARDLDDASDALFDMFEAIGGQVGSFFERKHLEEDRRKLEQQLNQAQKMEAIGQLSGGIAHDFNNILSAIDGYAHLAAADLPPDHPVQEYVNEIANARARASDLVRRILTFSRDQAPERRVIKLEPIVEEVVNLLRASLPATVELRTDFSADAPDVNADATQVHQILMNLATNASFAMAGQRPGRIEIRVESATVDEYLADIAPDLCEGRYALLSVSDTGCGMDEVTLQRIFEPFFTTKGPGEGTGLGLSVVHGIMKSHQGAVTAYSQPGQGTMFRLYFPMAQAAAPEAEQAPAAPARGHGEHVLLVDDEESLVYLGTRVLTRLGYRVTGFTDSGKAMRALEADPTAFDILISDCSMPRLSGFDLAAQALRLRPGFPVILVSGYIRPQDRETARCIGVEHLIVKPGTVEQLGQTLHEILEAAR